jgi:S1-C subfamily serine protease
MFLVSCGQMVIDPVAPKLGIVVDEKLQVIDIDAGGPGEMAGVQKGDTLISIADVLFSEKEKADAVIQAFPGGKPLRLLLERNGKTMEVQITPGTLTWWQSPLPIPTPMNPEEPFDYL